jgi:predicted RNA binding protein YcfA (HicA-like mRNA interferase family)
MASGWAKSRRAPPFIDSRRSEHGRMPPKVRELIAELEGAGFVNRGGKGSHRNFVHPRLSKPITISGKLGDDAKQYQIRAVRTAIAEVQK